MKNFIKLSLAALVVAFMAGCGAKQIENVPKQEVTKAKSSKAMYASIRKAGRGLGWIIRQGKGNTATGTLNLRAHQAVVDIKYTRSSYSITYKSSRNLNYNAADNTIHKNYNSWIRNLDNAIQIQAN